MLSSNAFSSRALRLFCLPMLAMCAAMACSDSSPPPDVAAPTMPPAAATGTVSLFMTDAPSDDFDEINVTVKEIKLEGGGSPKFTIFKGEATFDLKSLERFSDLFLVAADVPALTYEKIKMKVSAIELVDYDGDPEVIPLELPRGGKIELKTQAPFEVRPGGHLVIEIDMDAKKSIDLKLNRDGEYEFKPVVYVKIGEGRVPQKLSRVHGFIPDSGWRVRSFRTLYP